MLRVWYVPVRMNSSDFVALAAVGVFAGMLGEVLFTSVVDLVAPGFLKSWNVHGKRPMAQEAPTWRPLRDRRLVGYTFLWMVPVYAVTALVYVPLHEVLAPLPGAARAIATALYFFAIEFAFGLGYRTIIGVCPWDYSYSRWSILGVIRLDFAPIWLGVACLVEPRWSKILQLAQAAAAIFG